MNNRYGKSRGRNWYDYKNELDLVLCGATDKGTRKFLYTNLETRLYIALSDNTIRVLTEFAEDLYE